MSNRPYLTRVHTWDWKDRRAGTSTPGIAMRQGRYIVAHLTPGEAIDLANRLVDLVEGMTTNDQA